MINKWEFIKEIASDFFGLSALAWVFTHLILIAMWGTVQIYEGRPWILIIEIVYTGGALLLQIERIKKDLRKK